MYTHVDLFSGIGGFALAADCTWPDVEHTFVEIDPFCQAVIKKHWPQSPIYGDIRTFTSDAYRSGHVHGQSEEQSAERPNEAQRELVPSSRPSALPEIDLLTGGFPCQPFSQAGRRRGTEDDRHLWPEMLRVIREFHPRWIIGENVGGFVTWNNGMVLEQVHTDLENEGYTVQAFIIPAVSLNAPHRRDRVWIVAHNTAEGLQGKLRNPGESAESNRQAQNKGGEQASGFIGRAHDAPNTGNARLQGRGSEGAGQHGQRNRKGRDEGAGWSQNWSEVAAELCTLDDGLPNGLARPRGWRNAALKGAGNAIVPQVAQQIFQAIKEIDI